MLKCLVYFYSCNGAFIRCLLQHGWLEITELIHKVATAMRPASSLLLKTTMYLMVILKGKQSLTLNPMADSQKMNLQGHSIFSCPTGTLPKHTWSSRLIKWYWAKGHSLRWRLEGLSPDLCEHHIVTIGPPFSFFCTYLSCDHHVITLWLIVLMMFIVL